MIPAEAAENASRAPEKRTHVARTKLRDELKPLMTALNTNQMVPNMVLAPIASAQARAIPNLVGKVTVADLFSDSGVDIDLPPSLDALVAEKTIAKFDPNKWSGYRLVYSPTKRTIQF